MDIGPRSVNDVGNVRKYIPLAPPRVATDVVIGNHLTVYPESEGWQSPGRLTQSLRGELGASLRAAPVAHHDMGWPIRSKCGKDLSRGRKRGATAHTKVRGPRAQCIVARAKV